MNYIQNSISDNEAADMRPTSVLYNHRKLMNERMKHMAKMGLADSTKVNASKEQLKLCEQLKNRQMLYNMRGNEGDKEKLWEIAEDFKGVRLPYLR